ncbi:hypothetical protein [Pseudomonas putida]|uniref:hypothetical protein n=1 Tax=Pseudomonas putida TaxID=303 RepID=UPI000AF11EB0|nr:hypothetical protein [Pseudomonas putida]
MKNTILIVSISASTVALISACNGGPPKNPAPHDCETAQICAEIITTNDNSCTTSFGYSSTKAFALLNNHPSRKIYVTYEESVRHINSVAKDEKALKMVSVDPGKTATLGCWRTKGSLSEQYNEWSYTVPSACFANECPAPPVNKPVDTRDPKDDCRMLCDRDDPSCLKTVITGNSPIEKAIKSNLYKLTDSILKSALPSSIDLSPIVNLSNSFTGSNSCWRSDLAIDKPDPISSRFTNTGATCRVGFEAYDPRISSMEISFQGDWLGRFEKNAGTFTFTSDDEGHAPLMSLLKKDGVREYEPVTLINGSKGEITFTGAKYYCARVEWSGD